MKPEHAPPLELHGSSLLSKWGFGDGDALWDWHYDQTDEPPPEDVDHHDVLTHLVERHLLPVVEAAGHTFEVERVGTAHNPIRLAVVDGRAISHLQPVVDDALDDCEARVEAEEVWDAFRAVRQKNREEQGR